MEKGGNCGSVKLKGLDCCGKEYFHSHHSMVISFVSRIFPKQDLKMVRMGSIAYFIVQIEESDTTSIAGSSTVQKTFL